MANEWKAAGGPRERLLQSDDIPDRQSSFFSIFLVPHWFTLSTCFPFEVDRIPVFFQNSRIHLLGSAVVRD